ncbi:hypothetical protein [Xylanibacter rarus]|uniref:Uncharacterized protein n=1 Tax=Xylanibacter rarus TaxID=1676614 RepID=A0A8E1UQI5_9BACT|nr:hypothetical protein [Xylanibacter rarus]KOO67984.1 hypothetical protein ACU52_10255 [Xylanibacter rarus]
MLLQSRKMQYVFKKGSSPTTIWYNRLTVNNISHSKPCLQLITPGCHEADVMSQYINSSHRKRLTYSA